MSENQEKTYFCRYQNKNITPAEAMQCPNIYYHKTLCGHDSHKCGVLFNPAQTLPEPVKQKLSLEETTRNSMSTHGFMQEHYKHQPSEIIIT